MPVPAQRQYSLEEYFGIEEMSSVRHEYLGGEIYAMAGGSRNHNQLAQNLTRAFDGVRARGCRAYLSDVRLRTPGGLYTYPDVMVLCAAASLTPDRLETVTNPVVIAEVLSNSTRDYDAGQKYELYRAIPTLRDYLLVDQYAVAVEHRFLEGREWRSRIWRSREDEIALTGVPVTVSVTELYELVEL
ncbi:MAG TPA: Uma2 family endonuclease [Thermoanaerobaculia bacterium]